MFQIKGKVEQSRERSRALPLQLGVVPIEKEALRSPNFLYVYGLLSFILWCINLYGLSKVLVEGQ